MYALRVIRRISNTKQYLLRLLTNTEMDGGEKKNNSDIITIQRGRFSGLRKST